MDCGFVRFARVDTTIIVPLFVSWDSQSVQIEYNRSSLCFVGIAVNAKKVGSVFSGSWINTNDRFCFFLWSLDEYNRSSLCFCGIQSIQKIGSFFVGFDRYNENSRNVC